MVGEAVDFQSEGIGVIKDSQGRRFSESAEVLFTKPLLCGSQRQIPASLAQSSSVPSRFIGAACWGCQ